MQGLLLVVGLVLAATCCDSVAARGIESGAVNKMAAEAFLTSLKTGGVKQTADIVVNVKVYSDNTCTTLSTIYTETNYALTCEPVPNLANFYVQATCNITIDFFIESTCTSTSVLPVSVVPEQCSVNPMDTNSYLIAVCGPLTSSPSPSPSTTASTSASATTSPSTTASATTSASASPTTVADSESATPTQSPSVTPSASETPSSSTTPSITPSISTSPSASITPGATYLCRGRYQATDSWCDATCNHEPRVCPEDFCNCGVDVRPDANTNVLTCNAVSPATASWCEENCNHVPAFCPSFLCTCFYSAQAAQNAANALASAVYRSLNSAVSDDWCTQVCTMPQPNACLSFCRQE